MITTEEQIHRCIEARDGASEMRETFRDDKEMETIFHDDENMFQAIISSLQRLQELDKLFLEKNLKPVNRSSKKFRQTKLFEDGKGKVS